MAIYTVPSVDNFVNISLGIGNPIDSKLLNLIKDYSIGNPKTYFLGIHDDDITQVKTNSIDHSYKVYNILKKHLPDYAIITIIHKGKRVALVSDVK